MDDLPPRSFVARRRRVPHSQAQPWASPGFNIQLLAQDDFWVLPDGSVYALLDLTDEERSAVIRWLEGNARKFYVDVLIRHRVLPPGSTPLTVPEMLFESAEQWLGQRALLQGLRADE